MISLANAISVATGVLHAVGGTAHRTINGSKANRTVLAGLVGSQIHAHFSKHTSKAVAP